MKLLDVNVWLAASWLRHSQHLAASAWMDGEDDDLAFCRVTQMSFLRLLTNASITQADALTRRQAWEVLEKLMADSRVRLLVEPAGLDLIWKAFSRRDDRSHLLWTDDYLAAFAQAADAEFVTFDRRFHKRYTSVSTVLLA